MMFARLLWRGVTRRCPVCGQGHIFRRWFTMLERCPRCGLQFERVEGHLTGALGVNTVVSIIAVFVVGIVGFVLTYPELPLLPLTGAVVAAAIVVPLLCYPVSKTIWTAVDLRMRPLEPDEVADGYGEWIQF